MSHVPFTWLGNKRGELDEILPRLPPVGVIETFVEPFAGSAAVSFALYERGDRCRFVLNDTDPALLAFYEFLRENGLPAADSVARSSPLGRLATDAVNGVGFRKRDTPLRITARHRAFAEFIRSPYVTVTAGDWLNCAKKYASNGRACIYLDPPYFSSFNQAYASQTDGERFEVIDDKTVHENDITQLYVDIRELLETAAARVVVSITDVAIISHLYAPWIVSSYAVATGHHSVRGSDGKHRRKARTHLLIIGGGAGRASAAKSPPASSAAPSAAGKYSAALGKMLQVKNADAAPK